MGPNLLDMVIKLLYCQQKTRLRNQHADTWELSHWLIRCSRVKFMPAIFDRMIKPNMHIRQQNIWRQNHKCKKERQNILMILTIRTPNDHQSALCVCPLLFTTSGAMYSIVPQKEYALLSWSMASLLKPKSAETEREMKVRKQTHEDRKTNQTQMFADTCTDQLS